MISALQHHIEPMRSQINWGPSMPYHITGQMNRHPRAAIEWLDVSLFAKVGERLVLV